MAFFDTNTSLSSGEKDIEVADPPPDSISTLSFSPQADFLAVGSWDNNVRIYEVAANGQTQGKAMYSHQGPVLEACWSKDGTKIFSGGADNAGRMFDVSTGQSQQIASHDAPIRCVKWIEAPTGGILATGSWDKTVKYWDLRQQQPVSTITVPERVYAMDVTYPLLVVGLADRNITVYNLSNPTQVYRQLQSPLKWQTRSLATFIPNANGFAIGSVEGRVAIQHIEERDAGNNFSFKCHRKDQSPAQKDQALVYSVNAITFHPVHGTFSTAGSDGTVTFWDKDARTRLKTPGSIPASSFNHNGTIFAYAVSYDWHKGYSGMTAGYPNKIMLHACKDDEVKKRQKR